MPKWVLQYDKFGAIMRKNFKLKHRPVTCKPVITARDTGFPGILESRKRSFYIFHSVHSPHVLLRSISVYWTTTGHMTRNKVFEAQNTSQWSSQLCDILLGNGRCKSKHLKLAFASGPRVNYISADIFLLQGLALKC